MRRLLIISNRLPVHVVRQGEVPEIRSSSGGLVSAMNGFLQSAKSKDEFSEVLWIGCPGCSAKTWKQLKNDIPKTGYKYVPVFINQKIYNGYYNGFSNSTLWPLFHYFPSLTEFEKSDYENYVTANELFAETIIKEAQPDDMIWVHDYQLMLLPAMLRNRLPDASIGFFLHIPFPSYELFRLLPKDWRKSLLNGILGADLTGFHTNDYVMHFLQSVQLINGYENEMRLIYADNRIVKAEIFPISIDYQKFHHAYDQPAVSNMREELLERFSGQKIIFSVDRLDYTKGVIDRLRAYDEFLATYPEFIGKIVFILVVVPSRDSISKYSERKKNINEVIGFINGKYSSINWQPVIYRYSSLNFEELMSLYTGCDLALITPIRDGMNLVAKEFIASRKDKKGILILSEMAGASSELGESLLINPFDVEDVVRKIRQALVMSPREQEQRITAMQNRIKNYDVTRWATDFLMQLEQVKFRQQQLAAIYLRNSDRDKLYDEYSAADSRLLLLDYDGTLVKYSKHPVLAIPTEEVMQTLRDLSNIESNDVYIISGRDYTTLDKWFGHLNIGWVAEHGALLRMKNGKIIRRFDGNATWKTKALEILQMYVLRCPNTYIEEKEYSIAWHYRNTDKDLGTLRAKELYTELNDVFKNLNLQVIHGNKVIEIRTLGTDKGAAVRDILSKKHYDFVLAIGDDRTDEDMFRLLENEKAWTIKIGWQTTAAKFNLSATSAALELLKYLPEQEEAIRESREE